MSTETQNEHIYQWLLAGKSITTLEAMLRHGIGRLASRISDLINEYDVPIKKVNEPNTDGKGYHTRYFMDSDAISELKNVPLHDVRNVCLKMKLMPVH